MTNQEAESILEQSMMVIHKIAHNFSGLIDHDEAFSISMLAFYEAALKYDPRRNIPFLSYASNFASGKIKNSIRTQNSKKRGGLYQTISLDCPISDSDPDGRTVSETIATESNESEIIHCPEIEKYLLLCGSDFQKKTLEMRFGLNGNYPRSFKEICKDLERTSVQCIQSCEQQALKNIRKKLGVKQEIKRKNTC